MEIIVPKKSDTRYLVSFFYCSVWLHQHGGYEKCEILNRYQKKKKKKTRERKKEKNR